MYKYQPKRPVKSFQDLAVFQTTYNLAILITKTLSFRHSGKSSHLDASRIDSGQARMTDQKTILCKTTSQIPELIATAHSIRFADPDLAIAKLEQAMLNCNLACVHLMRWRDLSEGGFGTSSGLQGEKRPKDSSEPSALRSDFVDQLIKDYLAVRRKILNLQRSWQKFMKINKFRTSETKGFDTSPK